jgi:hypothetical protein
LAGPAKATISITGEDPTVSRTLQVLLSSLGYTVTLSRDPTAAPPSDAQLVLVVPGSANRTHETLVGRLEKTAVLAALPLLFLTTPGDRKDTQRNRTIRYVPWPCHLKTLQCEIESALQSVVDENL